MEELSPDMFVVPAIALTLVITLYVYFRRKVADQSGYRYFVITVAVVAYVLNLIWEVAQGPLYENFQYDGKHISICALASVADVFMVFILLFGFGLVYHSVFWVRHLSMSRSLLLVFVGGAGAILSEMWHTARNDWTYAESMPILPVVEVGLSPVLQFAILPLTVFLISRKTLPSYNFQSQKR